MVRVKKYHSGFYFKARLVIRHSPGAFWKAPERFKFNHKTHT